MVTGSQSGLRTALPMTGEHDDDAVAVLLAREAGYLKTRTACKMLGMGSKELLALRRRTIAAVFQERDLPIPPIPTAAQ